MTERDQAIAKARAENTELEKKLRREEREEKARQRRKEIKRKKKARKEAKKRERYAKSDESDEGDKLSRPTFGQEAAAKEVEQMEESIQESISRLDQ